jgi:lysophospholipase L1-like esterase
MSWFYRALTATAARQQGAVTRVLHYGDSLIDQDLITGALRESLQRRYGDGGHGFVLAAKPWRWYSQVGVSLAEEEGAWDHFRLVGGKTRDGRLGLGCAAVESTANRASVHLTLSHEIRASRVSVHYLGFPGGGDIDVLADGVRLARIATASPAIASGFRGLDLPRAPGRIRLLATGRVRLFGLVLENAGPGITWDNVPLIGARFHQLATLDETHWREQLLQRRPDLVVFQFGANDSISFGGDLERYGRGVALTLGRLRAALPRASCLVIGPLDRLERDPSGALRSPPLVRRVSDRQREVALAAGCAFWDGQRAMGGPGAMNDWLAEGLALKDMVHLSAKGSRLFAERLERALEQGRDAGRPRAALERHALQ